MAILDKLTGIVFICVGGAFMSVVIGLIVESVFTTDIYYAHPPLITKEKVLKFLNQTVPLGFAALLLANLIYAGFTIYGGGI